MESVKEKTDNGINYKIKNSNENKKNDFTPSTDFDEKEILKNIKQIAKVIKSNDDNRVKIFDMAEEHGIHITPVHFYEPIPDTRRLSNKIFESKPHFPELDLRENEQIELVKKLSKYSNELKEIPHKLSNNEQEYYFENNFFGAVDGTIYYSIIREFKPKKIIEIGAGFSTLIASKAAEKNEDTSITVIDPFPKDFVKKGLPKVDNIIAEQVQNVPIEKFKELIKNDILFIDSSHISAIGSDVNYLFLHVIPELNPGVLIHVHDCPIPFEHYGKRRTLIKKRFWNEMYLVWAFLIGNSSYKILLLNTFFMKKNASILLKSFPIIEGKKINGSSLWAQKF